MSIRPPLVSLLIALCLFSTAQASQPQCTRPKVAYINQLYRQAYMKSVHAAKVKAHNKRMNCPLGTCNRK